MTTFPPSAGTLTLSPGQTQSTISIKVTDDTIPEPTETFLAKLAVAVNATIADGEGVGTILDDDSMVSLSVADTQVTEATGTNGAPYSLAAFPVSLSAPSPKTVIVRFGTEDGTARVSSGDYDYVPPAGSTISFAPGETQKTISIKVTDDTIPEPSETFRLRLSLPANAAIADGEATGTIIDDDSAVGVSIADASASEGSAEMSFKVSLSAPASRLTTVRYSIGDGTGPGAATAADGDFIPTPGIISFQPGESEKGAIVRIVADQKAEGDETFRVTLTIPVNTAITDGIAIGTINDEAVAPPSSDTTGLEEFTPTSALIWEMDRLSQIWRPATSWRSTLISICPARA